MPLKNPDKLPALPKMRAKKAESVMAAIPDPKPDKLEYICKVFYKKEKLNSTYLPVLSLETVSEFSNFIYEIATDILLLKKELNLIILGLKTSTNSAPRVQPAIKEIKLENLVGEYIFNIYKRDGAVNSAVLRFNPFNQDIKLLKEYLPIKQNNRHFCKFEILST